jgi:nitric-oxide synthase
MPGHARSRPTGLVCSQVFAAGGMLYDTPGLHLHHRVPHMLTPAENKLLHPRRKLRPYVPPSPAELLEATTAACSMPGSGNGSSDFAAAPAAAQTPAAAASAGAAPAASEAASCAVATYWWGGLVKLQVLACPPDTELVFYGPQALLVEASVEPADAPIGSPSSGSDSDAGSGSPSARGAAGGAAQQQRHAAAEDGEGEEPHGFGAASVMRRGGLRPAKDLMLRGAADGGGRRGGRRPLADIAVSGE